MLSRIAFKLKSAFYNANETSNINANLKYLKSKDHFYQGSLYFFMVRNCQVKNILVILVVCW